MNDRIDLDVLMDIKFSNVLPFSQFVPIPVMHSPGKPQQIHLRYPLRMQLYGPALFENAAMLIQRIDTGIGRDL